jgi:hypothetical protein
MKTVWMCKDNGTPEQVPMDQMEIARRHWAGWRQCPAPTEKKPAEADAEQAPEHVEPASENHEAQQ